MYEKKGIEPLYPFGFGLSYTSFSYSNLKVSANAMDFSYWSPENKDWYAEPGKFTIMVGTSSAQIELKKEVKIIQ